MRLPRLFLVVGRQYTFIYKEFWLNYFSQPGEFKYKVISGEVAVRHAKSWTYSQYSYEGLADKKNGTEIKSLLIKTLYAEG